MKKEKAEKWSCTGQFLIRANLWSLCCLTSNLRPGGQRFAVVGFEKQWWSCGDDGTLLDIQWQAILGCSCFSNFFLFFQFFSFFFFSLITFVYCLLSRRRHTVSTTYLLHYTVPIVEGCQLPKILSEQSALIFSQEAKISLSTEKIINFQKIQHSNINILKKLDTLLTSYTIRKSEQQIICLNRGYFQKVQPQQKQLHPAHKTPSTPCSHC